MTNDKSIESELDSLFQRCWIARSRLEEPHTDLLNEARAKLRDYPDCKKSGDLIGQLVYWTQSTEDIAFAKNWLTNHKHHETYYEVVCALVVAKDREYIESAKTYIQREQQNARYDLVLNLIGASQEQDVIELVKLYLRAKAKSGNAGGPLYAGPRHQGRIDISVPNLLSALLHHSPTQESVTFAFEIHETWIGSPIEDMVLRCLLKADSADQRVIAQAQRWLAHNSVKKSAPSIRRMLDSGNT